MKNMRSLRSQALDLLRFPLAVIVVIVHVFTLEDLQIANVTYKISEYPILININAFISAFLRGVSVPIYFFISGYVFFLNKKFTWDVYISKIQNRVKSLLIPYVIWNTLALLLILLKEMPIFNSFVTSHLSIQDLSFENIISCFWKYNGGFSQVKIATSFPINVPLWYIRDLIILVLSAPMIYYGVRKLGGYALCFFFLVYLVSIILHWQTMTGLIKGYFFFSWGAYMSIYSVDMISCFKKYFKTSILLYLINGTLLLVLCLGEYSFCYSFIKLINSLLAVVATFNIAVYLLETNKVRVNAFLSKSSFFIYVAHALIFERVRKSFFILIKPETSLEVLFVYVITLLSVVLLLLMMFNLLKKYCLPVLSFTTGYKP